MRNQEVAKVFDQIASLLEIKGESIHRIRAYRRASESLMNLGEPIEGIWEAGQLEDIPGVGKAIAEKIDEYLRTGELEFYNRLVEEVPASLLDLLVIEGVGPKKAAQFWKELNITTLDELEKAAQAGKLRELSGMGVRSEAQILAGIESYRQRPTDRLRLDVAQDQADALKQALESLTGAQKVAIAGSLRRSRETIGDLDLVVAAKDPAAVLQTFTEMDAVQRVRGKGDTKASVEMQDGLRVQVWAYPPEEFGSALQYATGSQAHNVRLRETALKQGLSLSDHGFVDSDGAARLCPTEEEVYQRLGMSWIPPELREDRGEIAAAMARELPNLVGLNDLCGELHAHSTWSDGALSIAEMADAAITRGCKYLAITDHSRSLGVAGGLSIENLQQQKEEIQQIQGELGDEFTLLQGAEVEILSDGELDYPDEILEILDIVIISLHSSLRQPREVITNRLIRAIRNPNVDLIGHLTGRLIGRRDPADLDVEAILAIAAEENVALEINANPERLDLNDIHARRAIELGCTLAITTDAHNAEHLDFRKFGVGTARRAWVESDSVLNTRSSDDVVGWLKNHR